MAQGGIVQIVPTSIASAGTLAIVPSAGVEWLVKNIYYQGAVSFQKTDGTHPITFDSDGSAGAKQGFSFLCTSTCYLQITNTAASTAIYVCWDGIQTSA